MSAQFVINADGEKVSVIIPFAEYQSLLELAAMVDETTFLLREPNGSILRQCIDDVEHRRNVQERELLPDDPRFPGIIYRYGASGVATPVLRRTGLRVQTLVIDVYQSGMTPDQVAAEYDLPEARIIEALAFYNAHRAEIDAFIAAESALATAHG